MPRPVKNIGASVRARLLNVSREKNLNFELVLNRYATERLLYRLSKSRYADRFVTWSPRSKRICCLRRWPREMEISDLDSNVVYGQELTQFEVAT